MNNCSFVGRVTKDIELKQTQDGRNYCRFTLACDREFKKEDGTRDADFIPCVAWENRAKAIADYVKKGNRFGVSGHMRSGSYEGNNGKVYTLDLVVTGFDFLESRDARPDPDYSEPIEPPMEEVDDADLPF